MLRFLRLTNPTKGRINTDSLGCLKEHAYRQDCLLEGRPFGTGEVQERSGFCTELVAELKNDHGLLKRTEATEATIRLKLSKRMREHGMRATHIREQIELAINAFFLADRATHIAKALTASVGQQHDDRMRKYGYVSYHAGERIIGQGPPPKT